jgi:hypothetical protein
MIKQYIITGLMGFVLFCNTAIGQMDDFYWSDYHSAANSEAGKLTGTKFIYSVVMNVDYFYHKDWHKGNLITEDGETHTGISLRYDAFNDELVAYNPSVKGLFKVDKYIVRSFFVEVPGAGNQHFKRASLDEFSKREHFFEVLYEGGVTLMRRNRIIERKTSLYKNKYGKLDNRLYELMQQNFVLLPDQTVRRIYPGRKSVISLFPDKKRELRRLFRLNHIDDYTLRGLPRIVELMDREGYFYKK